MLGWLRMKRYLLPLLMAATVSSSVALAADTLTPAKYVAEVAVPVSYDYLLSLPEGYDQQPEKKWPLIVFLHGAGERGADLNQLKRHGPTRLIAEGKKFPAIVVAPQCKPEQIWNPHGVKGLADEIKRSHRVDADRVYLTGLSMGGFGTWETAMEYPKEWAALVPISWLRCTSSRQARTVSGALPAMRSASASAASMSCGPGTTWLT